MDDKTSRELWRLSKWILFMLLLIDLAVGLRILTVSSMTPGWFVVWLVVLTASYCADLTSCLVFLTKSFERGQTNLEMVATVVAWLGFTLWVGRASFLVLVAMLPVAIPIPVVTAMAFVPAALYFMVKLMCYYVPGNSK